MFITVEEFDCLFYLKLEGHTLWKYFEQRRCEHIFHDCVYVVHHRDELFLSQFIKKTEQEYLTPAKFSNEADEWMKQLRLFYNCYLMAEGLSSIEIVDIQNRVVEYNEKNLDPCNFFLEGDQQKAIRFSTNVLANAKRLTSLGPNQLREVVFCPFFADVIFELKNIKIPELQAA